MISLDLITSFLLLGGALGSLVFILSYLRTVDLTLYFARLILSLNLGITGVLWILFLRRLDFLEGEFYYWLILVGLFLVDTALWAQSWLLYKARRNGEED